MFPAAAQTLSPDNAPFPCCLLFLFTIILPIQFSPLLYRSLIPPPQKLCAKLCTAKHLT